MADLGTLDGSVSVAHGINAAGQVVGYSYTPDTPSTDIMHAFLYSHGTMADLNSLINPASGWILYKADAINDSGQIAGLGSKGAFP